MATGTVTITSTGPYGIGEYIEFNVNFDATTARGFPEPELVTSLGNAELFTVGAGYFFRYIVQAGDDTSSVDVTGYVGNLTDTSSNPVTITPATFSVDVDGIAPTPTITLDTDTGADGADGVTSDGSFTVTPSEGGTIEYSTDGGSNWSGTPPTPGQGPNTIIVRETELAGNVGTDTLTSTLDTVAPTLPGTPDIRASSDSGNTNSDDNTNSTSPTFGVDVSALSVGDTVELLLVSPSSVLATYTVTGSETDGIAEIPSGFLFDGSNAITARATDAAGNVGALSPALVITVDTMPPNTPGTPDLIAASDSGITNDNITNDTTPTFSVNVSALDVGDRLELVDTSNGDAVVASYVKAPGDTVVQVTASSLSDGTHGLATRAVDAAGNVSAPSGAINVVIDTTADATSDLTVSFTSAGLDTTYNASEPVQVTFSGIDADATGQLTITSDGPGSTPVVISGVTDAGSPITLTPAQMADLSDGNLSVTLDVTDTADNTEQATANSYDLDTTAPTVAVADSVSGAAVTLVSDSEVGNALLVTLTFSEPMDQAVDPTVTLVSGAQTTLTSPNTASPNGWTSPTTFVVEYTLADAGVELADITVEVEGAQDVAGNVMAASGPLSLTTEIDTLNPGDESESVPLDEIPDQDTAPTGTPVVLASLSGADGTTYAKGGTGGVYDAVEIVANGGDFDLQIIDDAASRAFFDLEENGPSITIDVVGTDDAGNATTSTITVDLNDLNDAPVLGAGPNQVANTAVERADGLPNENDTPFGTSGTFTVTDDDVTDTHSVSFSNGTSSHGSFLGFFQVGFDDPISGDGSGVVAWEFAIGDPLPAGTQDSQMAIVDALAAGETIVQTYTVTVTETNTGPTSETFTQTVTVTIEGTNDAPVISGAAVAAPVTEVVDDGITDQTLSATGTLNVADTDTSDEVTVDVTSVDVAAASTFTGMTPDNASLLAMMQVVAGDGATGTPGTDTGAMTADETAGSDFTWQFSAGDASSSPFDFLPSGETLVLEYTLTATDDSGAGVDETDTQVVTITITGTNDVPVIAGNSTAATTIEEAGGVENGTAGTNEATGTLNGMGANWSDADAGETALLEVTQAALDGSAQTALTFDPITGEAEVQGTYGTLYLSADGSYRYVLNDDDTDTQALNEGDSVTEVFNYTVANNGGGTGNKATASLTINIDGSNDTPVITFLEGEETGAVEEAGVDGSNAAINPDPTTATGVFAADDVDSGDGSSGTALVWTAVPDVSQAAGGTSSAIAGVYGTFSVDQSGNWTFTLNNNDPDVQALHDSESDRKSTRLNSSHSGESRMP